MIIRTFLTLAALAISATFFTSRAVAADATPAYELRIYTTNEGKLPDLLKRFREHTCKLFEKHGMTNIGYWVPMEKADGAENTLIYIISHKSRVAAGESWKAFGSDPEWQAVAKASEANGKILAKAPESIFMTVTPYSPEIKIVPAINDREPASGVFEMRTYTTPEGRLEMLHARFANHTMKLFEKHGMTNVAYFTPSDSEKGAGSKLIYFLRHPSKEAGLKAFTDFRADPDWIKAKTESEKDGPLTVQDGVKSVYMKAVDFSPIK